MRPTSKIILGIFLSIFITSVLFIIGFSFSERRNYNNHSSYFKSIPQDNPIGINVESFRVIVLEEDRTGVVIEEEKNGIIHTYVSYSESNGLTLNPITFGEENKLFFPEALNGFLAAKTNNDTLTIQIKVNELRKIYGGGKDYMSFSGINFALYTSNVNVVNRVNGFPVRVNNIETDSIKIFSCGDILIESCKAIVIDPVMDQNFRKLIVKNSVAQTIHLDLDRLGNWKLEGCDIGVENLTGSGRHHIIQHRNEKIKINWYPKNKDAELNISVPGDTTQIVFQ